MNEPLPQLPWYRPRLEYVAYLGWTWFALITAGRVLFRVDGWNGVYTEFHSAALGWANGYDIYLPGLEFRYPPIIAALLVPFSKLGEVWGSVLWRWMNMAIYLGSLVWAFRALFPTELGRLARASILLLLIPLSITSLNNAQVNGMLIGFLIGASIALREQRYRLAAFLAMGPVALKLYPVVFAMVAGLLYPRRFIAWFVMFVGLAAVLPFAFAETEYVANQYWQLYYAIVRDDRTGDITRAYRDLRLVFAHAGMPISDHAYQAIQVLAGAGIAAIAWIGQRRGWSRDRLLAYVLALVCCWMTLLGPATEKATYIFLAPVLAWLLVEAKREGWRSRFWMLLVIYLLYLIPVVIQGSAIRSAPVRVALPLATIPLFGYVVLRAIRDLRDPRTTTCA